MNSLQDNNSIFTFCDCGSEGIYLEYDPENCLEGIDLSLWVRGYRPCKMSLWRRIRVALHILLTGRMHTDQVILHAVQAEQLGTFLLNTSKVIQEKIVDIIVEAEEASLKEK
jgi:hypothetical protein